ncbi:hypothetical protein D5086_032514 [Populus alba]|uniref:Uncharacterized protein n=1 Tax=Populus alba TaxID=43335 RepID=A0ACC4ALJ3_POPAL
MYQRCGEMGFARMVFDVMGDRELVSRNSMISGYSKTSFSKEAIGLFMEMREKGFGPDEMTLVSVFGACGDLGLGRWVEGFVLQKKMEVNSYVGSALIDMYGKCSQNGASNEAIVLFNGMREAGPNPDKVIMIEVLRDDSAKIRVLMRQCGVFKTPCCNWIDIGARVHEFHVGDNLHHHSVNIYQLLNEEMKREVTFLISITYRGGKVENLRASISH